MPCASMTAWICEGYVSFDDVFFPYGNMSYLLLITGQISRAQGIRLSNDWDQINS